MSPLCNQGLSFVQTGRNDYLIWSEYLQDMVPVKRRSRIWHFSYGKTGCMRKLKNLMRTGNQDGLPN